MAAHIVMPVKEDYMPNWVLNKVCFYGKKDKRDELKAFVTSEDNKFDFNKIIPMPENLNLESGGEEAFAIKCALRNVTIVPADSWMSKRSLDDWIALGKKYLNNVVEYGYTTWYDWRVANWGTKWNSSDAEWNESDSVTFKTAWSMPNQIFETLAAKFPDVSIDVEFADEDIGYNCGRAYYNDGEFDNNSIVWESSPEFACNVWGIDIEEWKEEVS